MKFSSKSFMNQTIGNNSIVSYLVIFVTIVISISYLTESHYDSLILLYLIAGTIYLICKNLVFSLVISIILTNILLSYNLPKRFMKKHKRKLYERMENRKKNPSREALLQQGRKDPKGLIKKAGHTPPPPPSSLSKKNTISSSGKFSKQNSLSIGDISSDNVSHDKIIHKLNNNV